MNLADLRNCGIAGSEIDDGLPDRYRRNGRQERATASPDS